MVFENAQDYAGKIKRVVITEEEIKAKIGEAGKYIDSLYDGRPVLLVGILKGSFMFMAVVAKAVTVPCEIGFMAAKSYFE